MSTRQSSVTEMSVFRELTGMEYMKVLSEQLAGMIADALQKSGRFGSGAAFPVVMVVGQLYVKVLPHERDPKAFPVSLKLEVVPPEGLYRVVDEVGDGEDASPVTLDVPVRVEVGTTRENHPDKLREAHGLEVKQPVRTMSGRVANQVVKR